MKKLLILAAALAIAGCSKDGDSTGFSGAQAPVTVDPTITRATEVDFEEGDAVGLTITNDKGTYAENAKLVYTDGVLKGDLLWYDDLGLESTLKAYYPYLESAPTTFAVQADQTGDGYTASDFMMAAKEGVTPSGAPVSMTFKHKMTKIVVNIVNEYDMSVEGITISKAMNKASIDLEEQTVTVADDAETISISARESKAGEQYVAIIVPQTAALRVDAEINNGKESKVRTTTLAEAALKSGGQYSMTVTIQPWGIDADLSGDIEDWTDEGNLEGEEGTPEPEFEEFDGYFMYDGERYTTVKMKDDNTWMAENLRYVPAGKKPSDNLEAVTNGIWYPLVIDVLTADAASLKFSKEYADIKTNGYLYNTETALGLKTGDLNADNCTKYEGVQGICPKGWHIPTKADILGLVGKVNSEVNADAPYYDKDKAYGSIALLNADGFNADAWGALTIANTTVAKAGTMGALKTYLNGIASGYLAGSTYASHKANDDGSLNTCMFVGFMPMASNGTFNGSNNNFRNGVPVRCVKDKE